MQDNYDLSSLKGKKKRKNSRTKGNTFERKVCKVLNDAFGTNEFNRAPGSGAYATTHNLPENLKIYGDLITPTNFKFIVYCKKGYNKENLGSFFSEKSTLWSFIRQASRDARNSKKSFLVVFQQDRKSILTLFKIEDFNYSMLNDYIVINNEYVMTTLDQLLTFNYSNFFDSEED